MKNILLRKEAIQKAPPDIRHVGKQNPEAPAGTSQP
jgi:hypothetical protein